MLSDDDGGAVTETVTVEVTNVDPTLTLDAVTAIVEGDYGDVEWDLCGCWC